LLWLPAFGRARVSLARVDNLGFSLRSRTDQEAAKTHALLPAEWRRLELADVAMDYKGSSHERGFTLGPLHLEFRRGETAFLVGGNGSGKTTLAKMLVGLYLPDRGKIRIDDCRITGDTLEEYRQNFSAVFSDYCLFKRLIPELTPERRLRVEDCLARLRLNEHVRVEGCMLLAEPLSQGQRKRLALLIAYLEDRPFLVFDEWAADQDPTFKELFYKQLLPELREQGKTIVVVTHDDRYFHTAQRIIKLESGALVEDKRM
jgi:putative ATP-binding cassette transporter